jgi:hypothetical protein
MCSVPSLGSKEMLLMQESSAQGYLNIGTRPSQM